MVDKWKNITISKSGVTDVFISVTKDEEILNKMLVKITPPTSSNNFAAGKKDTKMVDLLRIEERVNIDGQLATDSTDTASTKKTNLISMFKAGGVLSMLYEGSTITGNMDKLQIDKVISDGLEPTVDETGYNVKFTFIKGVDL